MPTSRYERAARTAGYQVIAGLDEAGRGALFGPVFAAAVVLDPARPIRGLDDSKALDPDRRSVLAARIRERASAWAVGAADAFEIDRINILQASKLAMCRALNLLDVRCRSLEIRCDYLLIDFVKLDVEPSSQKVADSRRLAKLFDRRRIHSGEGRSRPRARRVGSRFPRLLPGQQ